MIAIEQIISRTYVRLGIRDTTEYDPEIRMYINEGAKGLFATDVKVLMCKEVDVDCHKAACDKNFLFFSVPTEICACTTTPCTGGCGKFYYFKTSTELQYAKSSGMNCCSATDFSYSGGYLNLPSNIDSKTIIVYYMGYNTDSDGYMFLDEDWERGLSAYAAFQFSSTAPMFNKFSGEFRARMQQEWNAQFNRQAGERFIREFRQNRNYILSVMTKSFIYYSKPQAGGFGGR